MADKYWNTVSQRLKSLGKTALSLAVPAAVDYAVIALVDKACAKIEENLKKLYTRTAVNSLINFVINLAGVLFLIFRPAGNKASKYITFAFFASSFVFYLIRTFRFIKNYGKTTLSVYKSIIRERSVYNGVEKYVLESFPVISIVYAGIDLGSNFIPTLKSIPSIKELIQYLVKVFWKRLALFGVIMSVYTITVFWIIKPLLVHKFI